MPSLVLIGPAVRPAIARIQRDKQINKQINRHNAFYMLDDFVLFMILIFYHFDDLRFLNTTRLHPFAR